MTSAMSAARSARPILRFASATALQQVAVEAVVAAMVRRYNPRPTPRADPSARGSAARSSSRAPSAVERVGARARRPADIRPRRLSPSRRLRHLDVADQLLVAAAPRRRPSGRRASAAPAPARRGPRSAGSPATIPASAGKAASSDWAKLWMVWIFRPPGQSSTLANSCRARSRVGGSLRSPSANRSFAGPLSLHPHPGREPRADAVRHFGRGRLGEGQAEDRFRRRALSSRRSTRAVRTCVLPVPADADSAAWTRGSAASACSPSSCGQGLEARAHAASKAAPNAIEIAP